MSFKWILAALVSFGVSAQATPLTDILVQRGVEALSDARAMALDFKKGEESNYSLDMGFLKGSMQILVEDILADGVWIQQNVELGFAGKNQIRILMDPNTGEIKKILVDGKEQQIPERGEVEVVETRQETITVPAGTFNTVYFKILDKTKNETIEQWVNLREIPIFGFAKSVTPSQFGSVTLLLKNFRNL